MATVIKKKASPEWKKIEGVINSQVSVKVGIMGSEAAELKTNGKKGTTVAQIATYHEFGYGVPRRSFLRDYFDQEIYDVFKIVAQAVGRAAKKGLALYTVGEFIGLLTTAKIRSRIDRHIPPPLHPTTIRRKGSSTPLVNTGQLKSSITYISETKRAVTP